MYIINCLVIIICYFIIISSNLIIIFYFSIAVLLDKLFDYLKSIIFPKLYMIE
jgi:hypothetical protein